MDRRVLIVSVNWLGDAVMALPALEAWSKDNSDASISVLCKPGLADFWRITDFSQDLEFIEKGFDGTRRTAKRLRPRGFSEAFVLPNSLRSAVIPWMAKIPKRRGMNAQWRNTLLNDGVPGFPEGLHQAQENFVLLGLPVPELTALPPVHLSPLPGHKTESESLLSGLDGPFWALTPGAARGPSKKWPAENFIQAGKELLAKEKGTILLLGGNGDATSCEEVQAGLGPRAVSLAGRTTLGGFTDVLKQCKAAIVNDSGGMHIAAVLGVPTVAIFGITDPSKTGPLGNSSVVLQHSDIRSRKVPRDCPEARAALARVTPREVIDALQQLEVIS